MMQENNSEWGLLVFFKNKNLLLIKKTKNRYKKRKKTCRLGFIKKRVFLNPDYLSILFL